MVKICLSAIVKNESKIIRRYLDSIKFLCDFICVTDTGSTDDTVKLIKEWGKENKIPTKVHIDQWKNFEYNRTRALDNSIHSYPQADYLFLMDADMLCENHGLVKENLTGNAYMVSQYNSVIEYSNVRLVSTKIKWHYVGVTHEYIAPKDPNVQEQRQECKNVKINDIGDGGSKDTKFSRDEKLLLDALKTVKPNDPLKDRYNFYLAQTYFDTGKYNKAIKYYNERLKGQGYFSEKWYSQFRIGLSYLKLEQYPKAENALLDAYSMMPSRCEPLVDLVSHYTLGDKPQYHRAYLYIPRLQEMKLEPNEDGLFNYIHYKQYYIDYLTSISAYYVGKLDIGRLACEYIDASVYAPEIIKMSARSNLKYYI